MASQDGHSNIVYVLLKAGGDPNIAMNVSGIVELNGSSLCQVCPLLHDQPQPFIYVTGLYDSALLQSADSFVCFIGERERANLIVPRALFSGIYIYIYLSRAMPYRKPSTHFQINATHDISQKFTTCV